MNSFDSGAIFPDRLFQELSRNAFVDSILLFQNRKVVQDIFFDDTKNRDFHEISSFLENNQEEFRKRLGLLRSDNNDFRKSAGDFSLVEI